MSRGKRAVAAERQLDHRREPADRAAFPFVTIEGGGRKIVLGGDRRQQRVRQPIIERDDRRRIAGKDPIGESIDLIDRQRCHSAFPFKCKFGGGASGARICSVPDMTSMQWPLTCTGCATPATFLMSSRIVLGRPISIPCSITRRVSRSRSGRSDNSRAASAAAALPVAGSSGVLLSGANMRARNRLPSSVTRRNRSSAKWSSLWG